MNANQSVRVSRIWKGLLFLVALVALALLALWCARGPDSGASLVALDEDRVSATTTANDEQSLPIPTAHRMARTIAPVAPPVLDPCLGLQLLDIETGDDGKVRGVWLRNDEAGPSLVRPGEKFAASRLVRVAAGADPRPATLWFESAVSPCELKLVPGIDLSTVAPGARPKKLYERDPTERQGSVRNVARRRSPSPFGVR